MKKDDITKRRKTRLVILSVISVIYMCIYLIWRALYTIPGHTEYGWVATIAGIFLLCAETISAVEAFYHYLDLNAKGSPEMPIIPDEWYPDVDVFIATHNESEQILFKTANACKYLKYPDKSKVHIYLCDDGNRAAIKELADRIGVNYIGLANNKLAKAGNLNNALKLTHSPLIVTFDADMIPNSEFLLETVPYFFLPVMEKNAEGVWVEKSEEEKNKAEKIGFIQTPQTFYNPDLFQYNLYTENKIPNEQDYFFRRINVGKNEFNAPIYAGSNTVISREALEEVGGIRTGTITEDFETGLFIQMAGYRCYAVDKLLAKGLAPDTVKQLIQQRERWARGCIYSLRRVHILLNPKIPVKLKLSYYMCRLYWGSFTRRAIYMTAPILFVLFGIPVVICNLKDILLFWLPAYLLYNTALRFTSGSIRNTRWSNIVDTIMFPYLIIPIWMENIGIQKKKFMVTNKERAEQEDDKILSLPYIILLVLSAIAVVICGYEIIVRQYMGSLVVAYWLCVNISTLGMAILFMFGRKNTRQSERFLASLDVQVEYKDHTYRGCTTDLSEGGLAFLLDDAVFLPYKEDGEVVIHIYDREYTVKVNGKIVSVVEQDNRWKYCVSLKELDDEAQGVYMQIIYDREHTLPKTISMESNVLGDFLANFHRRTDGVHSMKRKTARIQVGESFQTKEGKEVFIEDFNFIYFRLRKNGFLKDRYHIILGEDLVVRCQNEGQTKGLYRIENTDELESNDAYFELIRQWQGRDNDTQTE